MIHSAPQPLNIDPNVWLQKSPINTLDKIKIKGIDFPIMTIHLFYEQLEEDFLGLDLD